MACGCWGVRGLNNEGGKGSVWSFSHTHHQCAAAEALAFAASDKKRARGIMVEVSRHIFFAVALTLPLETRGATGCILVLPLGPHPLPLGFWGPEAPLRQGATCQYPRAGALRPVQNGGCRRRGPKPTHHGRELHDQPGQEVAPVSLQSLSAALE
jgi:hypothetical protein